MTIGSRMLFLGLCPASENTHRVMGDFRTYAQLLMPRGRPKLGNKALAKQAALADASNRLKLLEKAGFNQDKQGAVLAKILVKAEEMLDNPDLDPFAKAAWAKLLVRDIMDIRPPKLPGLGSGAQTPVTINIGELPPAPARGVKDVTPGLPPVVQGLGGERGDLAEGEG